MSRLVDRLYLTFLGVQARSRERRRWSFPPGSRSVTPRVFYGKDKLPDRSEVAGGGIVKCQDLASTFPSVPERPNVLYLVSSALPVQAAHMARLARKAGAVLVLNQNGVAYPAWHGPGWERENRPMRDVLREADHVFYQSEFCRMAADRFLGERQGSWEILYNPVDTGYFVPAGVPGAAGRPILLCAGSHQSFYRVQVAIEVLAHVAQEIPGARLTLAGSFKWHHSESVSLGEVRQFARRKGVEQAVDIQGPYTQEQAPALFQRAQVLLHTKYADPCPRVVVEAMACGLPVAYSATGGVPELVGDLAGEGVPGPVDWERDHPPSSKEMAAAVLKILGSRERYADEARSRAVARFDVVPWIRRHEVVFRKLLGGEGV